VRLSHNRIPAGQGLPRGTHRSLSIVQYSSWLGRTQLAKREPEAPGHELLLHPSFPGRVRSSVWWCAGGGGGDG
jgi:hypothetical protein